MTEPHSSSVYGSESSLVLFTRIQSKGAFWVLKNFTKNEKTASPNPYSKCSVCMSDDWSLREGREEYTQCQFWCKQNIRERQWTDCLHIPPTFFVVMVRLELIAMLPHFSSLNTKGNWIKISYKLLTGVMFYFCYLKIIFSKISSLPTFCSVSLGILFFLLSFTVLAFVDLITQVNCSLYL